MTTPNSERAQPSAFLRSLLPSPMEGLYEQIMSIRVRVTAEERI